MQSVTILKGLIFAAALASAGSAQAKEAPEAIAETPAATPDLEVMNADKLGALSGGAAFGDSILTDQTLLSSVQGNKVTGYNVGSGDIRLNANAFTGFEGIGNFVLNTGHNNALQSSMNVSILLANPQ